MYIFIYIYMYIYTYIYIYMYIYTRPEIVFEAHNRRRGHLLSSAAAPSGIGERRTLAFTRYPCT